MNLSYFRALIIAVSLAQFASGSRITSNEASINLPTNENNVEPVKLKTKESDVDNKISSTNVVAQQTKVTDVPSEPPHTKNNDILVAKTENSVRTSFPEPTVGVDQEPSNLSAINVFAQRVGNIIFHNAPKDLSPPNASESQIESVGARTLIWSPFSVYQALVPLFYASDGETKDELRQLLLQPQINPNATAASNGSLSTLPDFPDLNEVLRSGKALSSVTGLFARDSITINPEYVQEVEKQLKNVDVKKVDFARSVDAAANINTWINESTKGLITEAVDATQLTPEMLMLIVNCVRFKASWLTRFNTKLTKVREFHGVNGVQKVQMMKQIGTLKFSKFPIIFSTDYVRETGNNDGSAVPFSVLEMPYADDDFVSLFILPDTSEKLQATMDYVEKVGVSEIRRNLIYSDVEVFMPKFRVKSDVNVQEALVKNGLKTLFDPVNANLTKFIASRSVSQNNSAQVDSTTDDKFVPAPYVSNIIHRTIFETSEEGTTAAALTALSIIPLSALAHDRVYRFNLNRPFIVLLVKNDNTIVFQGVIADLIGQDLSEPLTADKNSMDEKTSSHLPSRNSLVYPSESDSKAELDKLLNSNIKEDEADLTGSATMGTAENALLPAPVEELNNDELNSKESSEDRAWWIPKGIPAYLLPASFNSSATEAPVKNSSKEVVISEQVPQTSSSAPAKTPAEFIQFSKYQQPEPKDPDGIRFPATIPLARNKVNIKPRYDNNEHRNMKNTLLRWMSVY